MEGFLLAQDIRRLVTWSLKMTEWIGDCTNMDYETG